MMGRECMLQQRCDGEEDWMFGSSGCILQPLYTLSHHYMIPGFAGDAHGLLNPLHAFCCRDVLLAFQHAEMVPDLL